MFLHCEDLSSTATGSVVIFNGNRDTSYDTAGFWHGKCSGPVSLVSLKQCVIKGGGGARGCQATGKF